MSKVKGCSRSFYESYFYAFCAENFFAERGGYFRVKPSAGKNIQIDTAFVLGKMCGDGTRLDELYERVAGGEGIFVTKMRNERPAVALHADDIIAEFDNKFFYFCPGGYGLQITSV